MKLPPSFGVCIIGMVAFFAPRCRSASLPLTSGIIPKFDESASSTKFSRKIKLAAPTGIDHNEIEPHACSASDDRVGYSYLSPGSHKYSHPNRTASRLGPKGKRYYVSIQGKRFGPFDFSGDVDAVRQHPLYVSADNYVFSAEKDGAVYVFTKKSQFGPFQSISGYSDSNGQWCLSTIAASPRKKRRTHSRRTTQEPMSEFVLSDDRQFGPYENVAGCYGSQWVERKTGADGRLRYSAYGIRGGVVRQTAHYDNFQSVSQAQGAYILGATLFFDGHPYEIRRSESAMTVFRAENSPKWAVGLNSNQILFSDRIIASFSGHLKNYYFSPLAKNWAIHLCSEATYNSYYGTYEEEDCYLYFSDGSRISFRARDESPFMFLSDSTWQFGSQRGAIGGGAKESSGTFLNSPLWVLTGMSGSGGAATLGEEKLPYGANGDNSTRQRLWDAQLAHSLRSPTSRRRSRFPEQGYGLIKNSDQYPVRWRKNCDFQKIENSWYVVY